jgi:hypothetical protein
MINDGTLDGIAGIAAGAYLISVVYQGNFWPFWDKMLTEVGYLEFLVAVAVLNYVYQNDKTGLAGPFIALGILAASIKYASQFNYSQALADYASGNKTLFQTVYAVVN